MKSDNLLINMTTLRPGRLDNSPLVTKIIQQNLRTNNKAALIIFECLLCSRCYANSIVWIFSFCSWQSYKVCLSLSLHDIITIILQMWKLRQRVVKYLVQCQAAKKWKGCVWTLIGLFWSPRPWTSHHTMTPLCPPFLSELYKVLRKTSLPKEEFVF